MPEIVEDPMRSAALIPRLAAGAALTGGFGGAAAALLYVSLGAGDASAAAHLLGLVLTGAALLAFFWAWTHPLAADPWLIGAVGAAIAVSALVQAWPEIAWTPEDIYGHGIGLLLFAAFYGGTLGLLPAGFSLALIIGVFLLLRILRVRIPARAGGFVVVAVSVALTAAFALTTALALDLTAVADRLQFVGLTTAVAGLGAIGGARWALLYRPHE